MPAWGFPPVVWKSAPTAGADAPTRSAAGRLRFGALAALLTSVAAGIAAGAETWRYAQLLRGRTYVLSGREVAAADALVAASAWTATALGLLTAVLTVRAIVPAYAQAASQRDRRPARPPAAVLARLVIPPLNFYGAGQILAELDTITRPPPPEDAARGEDGDPTAGDGVVGRTSRLVTLWWLAWLANGALVLTTLGRAFGRSTQAVADTVELHIAVDLCAALLAGVTVVLLRRLARQLDHRSNSSTAGWVVAPPAPTSDRGSGLAPTRLSASDPACAGDPGAAAIVDAGTEPPASVDRAGDQPRESPDDRPERPSDDLPAAAQAGGAGRLP